MLFFVVIAMKTLLKISLVALLALCAFTTIQAADTPPEVWTLSLGGSGATATSGDSTTAFGAELDLGRTGHLLLPVHGGLRQTFNYNSVEDGEDSTIFSTKAYLDATLFNYKKLDLFAGANVGLAYGDTKPDWGIAPEAGLRFWIKEGVAIVTRVEYPYNLTDGRWNDTLRYFLGFRINL
jgi:hypothetical protein